MSTGDAALDEQIRLWMEWDKNEKTRAEVEKLIKDNARDELRARMIGRIKFGTAGLRGTMGAGFKRMNDLVVLQATQGLCDYLLTVKPNAKSLSVAIGYDVRHNSRRFAELAGTVLLRKGVKVYFFSKYVPTPLVSYAVTYYKCDAGIMITASHNPKDDNGYKVYWGNGAQLAAPHDAGVLKHIEANLAPWPETWDTSILQTSPICLDPLKEVFAQYLVDNEIICFHRDANRLSTAKMTFSPVHGVGTAYVLPMLKQFGFNTANVVLVKEQAEPDPDFPTAPFPNPEEGEKVLKFSMRAADESNSKLVLCTDPDADRFQMAEKQPSGEWYIFSGNEMGALLTWWLWQNRKRINDKLQSEDFYVINSAVSTKFAKTMALKEGFNYEETLTGFKWLANRTYELRSKGKVVLLAWEESIGYMPGASLDKDGVVTCAVFADFSTFLSHKKVTFTEQLNEIYSSYGIHLCYNSYLVCPEPERMVSLFEDLRKADPDKGYATKCGECQVKYVRDLAIGYDNSYADNKPILPWNASNHMITYTLDNGSTFTIRGSGTEPKIKFYIEIILPPDQSKNREEAKRQLDNLKSIIIRDFFQPEKHGLIMRSAK